MNPFFSVIVLSLCFANFVFFIQTIVVYLREPEFVCSQPLDIILGCFLFLIIVTLITDCATPKQTTGKKFLNFIWKIIGIGCNAYSIYGVLNTNTDMCSKYFYIYFSRYVATLVAIILVSFIYLIGQYDTKSPVVVPHQIENV